MSRLNAYRCICTVWNSFRYVQMLEPFTWTARSGVSGLVTETYVLMMMMCETLVPIPTIRAQARERGSTVYTLTERKRKNATWEGKKRSEKRFIFCRQNSLFFVLFLLPSHLLPRCHRSSCEDEDYGGNVQRAPDEEGQCPPTASQRGEPGQADEQDGAQTENHADHRQSAHMVIEVLWSELQNWKWALSWRFNKKNPKQ